MKLEHDFVEFIPKELEDGKLYISIRFKTAAHLCACGCGIKTFTPLSPTDWKLTFDGKTVSLHPSIGNWAFPCRSHYWITKSKIEWSTQWSNEEIKQGRELNRLRKKDYYSRSATDLVEDTSNQHNNEKSPWWKFSWLFK